MKSLLQTVRRIAENFGNLFLSQSALSKRALLRTQASEQKINEAERLDRLRNPGDYRGR